MILLTLGVLLFTLIHLYPCFAASHRAACASGWGESLQGTLLVAGVHRHRLHHCRLAHRQPLPLYFLPAWGPTLMMAVMPIALILFCSGQGPNHLRRWLVHPQLLGTLLWAGAHLAVNSEARSWCCLAASACGRW